MTRGYKYSKTEIRLLELDRKNSSALPYPSRVNLLAYIYRPTSTPLPDSFATNTTREVLAHMPPNLLPRAHP